MIQKITNIQGMGVFDGFEWDKHLLKDGRPLRFGDINILYGQNYTGKTTLSRILRALETRTLPKKYDHIRFSVICDGSLTISQDTLDKAVNLPVRVFNEDFVRDNLRFLSDPDGEIAPFAILGADNAAIQSSIDRLRAELGSDEEGKTSGLYGEYMRRARNASLAQGNLKSAKEQFDKICRDKALGRQNGIKYQPQIYGDQNYSMKKLYSDIQQTQSTQYHQIPAAEIDSLRKKTQEQVKPPIAWIPSLQQLVLPWETLCEVVSELVSRKIGTSRKIQELLRNAALNQWVKRGAELLEGQRVCAFCGNPISDERWAVIRAHFDEETRRLEQDIEKAEATIDAMKIRVRDFLNLQPETFYLQYQRDASNLMERWKQAYISYEYAMNELSRQLQSRKEAITADFQFERPAFDENSHLALLQAANQLIQNNNLYSRHIGEEKRKAQFTLRLQTVYEFCRDIDYRGWMRRIQFLEAEAKNAAKSRDEIWSLIQEKETLLRERLAQLNDEEAGARRVNEYLNDYFGHRFLSLVSEKVQEEGKRIRFRIIRDGKPAYNLSEGECSLIAFCYFMAKLDDVNTAGVKPVIWIDDPISSLDSNHVYFVYSLISAKIVNPGNYTQLFISTHNLDFLKYLHRLKGKGNKGNFFIERIGHHSTLSDMPIYLKENATEFNYLFSVLYRCAQCDAVTDETYDLLYNFGNNARKFFEIYFYFKYPNPNLHKLEPKLERFFAPETVPPVLINRIVNEDSHGSSLEKSMRREIDPETIPAAKKIMSILQKTDPQQYQALVDSIQRYH